MVKAMITFQRRVKLSSCFKIENVVIFVLFFNADSMSSNDSVEVQCKLNILTWLLL